MLESLGVSREDLWQSGYQEFGEGREQGVFGDWPKLEQNYEKSFHKPLGHEKLRGKTKRKKTTKWLFEGQRENGPHRKVTVKLSGREKNGFPEILLHLKWWIVDATCRATKYRKSCKEPCKFIWRNCLSWHGKQVKWFDRQYQISVDGSYTTDKGRKNP